METFIGFTFGVAHIENERRGEGRVEFYSLGGFHGVFDSYNYWLAILVLDLN